MMKKDGKCTLTPRLRFPEFQDKPGWDKKPLRTIASPVTEKADPAREHNVLTLSAEQGIVLQSDYFGKKVAGNDPARYIKIKRDDFVYNDRTTTQSVYGTIRRLSQHDDGIVSPIYKCFRFGDDEIPEFWQWYFESGKHNQELAALVNEGARAGRFNISPDKFLSTAVWCGSHPEQQKIADCLSSLDGLIAAEGRKLEALRAHKKGLMQQLFPRPGETRPRLRFPEFHNAPEWEEREVGKVFRVTRGEVLAMPLVQVQKTSDTPYPVYSSQTKNRGLAGFYSEYLYEDAITWTTDGANAGDVNYRAGKFYCTNVCGVLLSDDGYANPCIAELLNCVTRQHVSYVGNPKLMNGVMAKIIVPFPDVEEQRRIAGLISSLDYVISAQEQALRILQTHKKGLMQQLFPSPEGVEA